MPNTPKNVAQITAEWLDTVLRESAALGNRRVAGVESTVIGEGVGYLSSVARVKLVYDGAGQQGSANGLPETVIVKIAPHNEIFRRLGEEMRAFEREIRFYREVAATVPLRLPKVYHTQCEPPDYAIVMEDLGFCEAGDQLVGMHERQVIVTARTMGKLQARFWNNDNLHGLEWMPNSWSLWKHYTDHWPSFVERCRQWMGPEHLVLGRRVAEHFDWIIDEMNGAPPTIVHCDLREDNLLFGPPDTLEEVLIVDWQLAIRNMGAYDVASLQGGSELAAERRGHPFTVLRAWHETLTTEGVREYSYDDALYHFRLASLICLTLPVYFHKAALDGGIARAPKLCETQARRHFGAALEIDAGSILPG